MESLEIMHKAKLQARLNRVHRNKKKAIQRLLDELVADGAVQLIHNHNGYVNFRYLEE